MNKGNVFRLGYKSWTGVRVHHIMYRMLYIVLVKLCYLPPSICCASLIYPQIPSKCNIISKCLIFEHTNICSCHMTLLNSDILIMESQMRPLFSCKRIIGEKSPNNQIVIVHFGIPAPNQGRNSFTDNMDSNGGRRIRTLK